MFWDRVHCDGLAYKVYHSNRKDPQNFVTTGPDFTERKRHRVAY